MLTAFVLLYAEPSRIAALGAALAAIDGVTEVYSVTGDEDLLVVIRVADHTEIPRIGAGEIGGLRRNHGSRKADGVREYGPAGHGFWPGEGGVMADTDDALDAVEAAMGDAHADLEMLVRIPSISAA